MGTRACRRFSSTKSFLQHDETMLPSTVRASPRRETSESIPVE